MDNGEVDTIGFAIDKENLRILRAKIDAMLMDENKKQTNPKRKPNSITLMIRSPVRSITCYSSKVIAPPKGRCVTDLN